MRALKATILAAIVAVPLAAAAGQAPPNSFDSVRRGKVNLSHQALRITACVAKVEQQKTTCVPTADTTDSSTTITLRPVSQGDVASKDKREPREVSLSKDANAVEKLELGVGVWELDWPARNQKDRFFVAEGDEFAVKLHTQVGACTKTKDECRLKTDQTKLEVKIPKRCRR
ncbi:MAG: hypothetical protein IPI67_31070 [Myxococcales bacterium]|nr:hypothetical protein [Myxococcales bacterium]